MKLVGGRSTRTTVLAAVQAIVLIAAFSSWRSDKCTHPAPARVGDHAGGSNTPTQDEASSLAVRPAGLEAWDLASAPQPSGPKSTTHGGLRIQETCQPGHAKELVQQFRRLHDEQGYVFAGCPSGDWMEELKKLLPAGRRVFVDVGCNKGYSSSGFLARFAPELEFNNRKVHDFLPEHLDVPSRCGVCRDCNDPVPEPAEARALQLDLVCVEPTANNYALLVGMREQYIAPISKQFLHLKWHILHAAVSNTTGWLQFVRCTPGEEACAIHRKEAEWDQVPMTTVDDIVDMYSLPHIDVLKIDAEGHDPNVIAGALGAIKGGKVSVVTFEHTDTGMWKEWGLERAVNLLARFDFVCYMDAATTPEGSLYRLTGCFDPGYAYDWSNVMCVRRDHALYPVAERLSSRYVLHKDAYFQTVAM